jgi:glutamate decarboxylase
MGALLQCSAFLIKHDVLLNCNEMQATYLFQQDKHYDVAYDTGDKTIQCGRHVDVFKLWLMWRAKVILFISNSYHFQLNKTVFVCNS